MIERIRLVDDAAAQAPETAEAPAPHDVRPVRRRLPKQRSAMVTRFSVAGAEGVSALVIET